MPNKFQFSNRTASSCAPFIVRKIHKTASLDLHKNRPRFFFIPLDIFAPLALQKLKSAKTNVYYAFLIYHNFVIDQQQVTLSLRYFSCHSV